MFTPAGAGGTGFLDWIAAGFKAEILRASLASGALTFEPVPGRPPEAPGTPGDGARSARSPDRLGRGRQRRQSIAGSRSSRSPARRDARRTTKENGSSPSEPSGGAAGCRKRGPPGHSPSACSSSRTAPVPRPATCERWPGAAGIS